VVSQECSSSSSSSSSSTLMVASLALRAGCYLQTGGRQQQQQSVIWVAHDSGTYVSGSSALRFTHQLALLPDNTLGAA
jgi:hypothetical protein